jgi:Lanthionine synthetase C-like protein
MKPWQSLSGGAAGIALLHIEQARGGAATWDQANATLTQAVADGVSIAASASLYYGAPALSFVLHGAADRPGLGRAMATADAGTATVTRHRLEAAHARIDQMAHGICGPLALLALTLSDSIKVDGQPEAITRICRWLDAWEQHKAGGGSWWPQIVTLADLDRGTTSQQGPLRPSWCYGTPGIARAQQLAARALLDPARQQHAEAAFIDCLNDPVQLGRLLDRSLCHGTGGLLVTARSIAADALIPIPLTQPLLLHRHAAAQADEPPGFLVGSAGAALAAAETATSWWDACLLLR